MREGGIPNDVLAARLESVGIEVPYDLNSEQGLRGVCNDLIGIIKVMEQAASHASDFIAQSRPYDLRNISVKVNADKDVLESLYETVDGIPLTPMTALLTAAYQEIDALRGIAGRSLTKEERIKIAGTYTAEEIVELLRTRYPNAIREISIGTEAAPSKGQHHLDLNLNPDTPPEQPTVSKATGRHPYRLKEQVEGPNMWEGETVFAWDRNADFLLVSKSPDREHFPQVLVHESKLIPLKPIPRLSDEKIEEAGRYIDEHDSDSHDTRHLLAHYLDLKMVEIERVLKDPVGVHHNMLRGVIALPSFIDLLHVHSGAAVDLWFNLEELSKHGRLLRGGVRAMMTEGEDLGGDGENLIAIFSGLAELFVEFRKRETSRQAP